MIGEDINEADILELISRYKKLKIIVTPIGGNGFIFRRGSRQISVKRYLGRTTGNIIIAAKNLHFMLGILFVLMIAK